MSTGRHADDTASQHQPRTRQQPREMHNPALCSLEAAAPPPHTHQIQQDTDVSRWIPGRRPGAAEAGGLAGRVPAQGQGRDQIRAHDTARAAMRASPVTTRMAIEPSMRSIPDPTCWAVTAWT